MSEASHPRRLCAGFALVLLGLSAIGGALLSSTSSAEAQFFERRQRPEGFNPFGFIFGGGGRPNEPRDYRWERRAPRQGQPAQAEQTRPPPPAQKQDTPPSKHIVVMGTALSDWLAYGLEEAYADQPEVGIVRKNQLFSGLVKFDAKEEQTWPQVARDFLKDQNPDVIVVMLGLEDRQAIRVKPPATEQGEGQSAQSTAKPEPRRRATQLEFRTDEWAEVYSKRIDEMIAALKSKGAPVIWVGLPAIRGTRSTSDMIYLNDLFRARADRAGIVYVDVWDGFVNEGGRYSAYGPDVDGQVRRLRTSEGVYMTKAGAGKLAHYVDREIKRVMGTRLQMISAPTPDDSARPTAVKPGGPAARPVAGPVVSLTGTTGGDELLGAGSRPSVTDPLAVRVLVKGGVVAPPAGRADNFFLTKEAEEAAQKAALELEQAEARALAARPPPAAASRTSIVTDEPNADARPERPARATSPGSDPAAPAATVRRPTPPRSAERRAQQQYRPLSQDPRLAPPRDVGRVTPQRSRPPVFDPFGLFR